MQPLQKLKGRHERDVLLIILDGIGLTEANAGNAVAAANTPCLDRLFKEATFQTTLLAHGLAVGLPSWQDIGNSEVGHNALGAGRIFPQGATLVNKAIRSGGLFESKAWCDLIQGLKGGHVLHFLGLLSDGNVHSHIDHLFAMIEKAASQGLKKMFVHVLLDGRDVAPQSAGQYVKKAQSFFEEVNEKWGCQVQLASGGGRMVITMDRYNADWPMVRRGWQTHVFGQGRHIQSVAAEIDRQYQTGKLKTDQYLEPFVVVDSDDKPVGLIKDGDGVIFFNFRGDRAIEISRAFEEDDFNEFDRSFEGQAPPHVLYRGMMQYDGDLKIPKQFLVKPPKFEGTISHYLAATSIKSFAISETQKYGHVTYFWNGNASGKVNEDLETYVEIPSLNVPFDQAPKMRAQEIAEKTVELLESKNYQFGRINFPNGDMVGHTGNFEAAVTAVEEVDHWTDVLIKKQSELGGISVILADHGNCEEMFTEKEGRREIKTSHTTNPVPFFIVDEARSSYKKAEIHQAGLANVAATLINLLGYKAPKGYEPSLIKESAE